MLQFVILGANQNGIEDYLKNSGFSTLVNNNNNNSTSSSVKTIKTHNMQGYILPAFDENSDDSKQNKFEQSVRETFKDNTALKIILVISNKKEIIPSMKLLIKWFPGIATTQNSFLIASGSLECGISEITEEFGSYQKSPTMDDELKPVFNNLNTNNFQKDTRASLYHTISKKNNVQDLIQFAAEDDQFDVPKLNQEKKNPPIIPDKKKQENFLEEIKKLPLVAIKLPEKSSEEKYQETITINENKLAEKPEFDLENLANAIKKKSQQAFEQKPINIIVGEYGTGKTMLINFLQGKKFFLYNEKYPLLLDETEEKFRLAADWNKPQTQQPNSIEINGHHFVDMPGYRNPDVTTNITHSISNSLVIQKTKNIKIIFVLSDKQYQPKNTRWLDNAFELLLQQFPNLNNACNALLIVVHGSKLTRQIVVDAIKKSSLSESIKTRFKNKDNMLRFEPINPSFSAHTHTQMLDKIKKTKFTSDKPQPFIEEMHRIAFDQKIKQDVEEIQSAIISTNITSNFKSMPETIKRKYNALNQFQQWFPQLSTSIEQVHSKITETLKDEIAEGVGKTLQETQSNKIIGDYPRCIDNIKKLKTDLEVFINIQRSFPTIKFELLSQKTKDCIQKFINIILPEIKHIGQKDVIDNSAYNYLEFIKLLQPLEKMDLYYKKDFEISTKELISNFNSSINGKMKLYVALEMQIAIELFSGSMGKHEELYLLQEHVNRKIGKIEKKYQDLVIKNTGSTKFDVDKINMIIDIEKSHENYPDRISENLIQKIKKLNEYNFLHLKEEKEEIAISDKLDGLIKKIKDENLVLDKNNLLQAVPRTITVDNLCGLGSVNEVIIREIYRYKDVDYQKIALENLAQKGDELIKTYKKWHKTRLAHVFFNLRAISMIFEIIDIENKDNNAFFQGEYNLCPADKDLQKHCFDVTIASTHPKIPIQTQAQLLKEFIRNCQEIEFYEQHNERSTDFDFNVFDQTKDTLRVKYDQEKYKSFSDHMGNAIKTILQHVLLEGPENIKDCESIVNFSTKHESVLKFDFSYPNNQSFIKGMSTLVARIKKNGIPSEITKTSPKDNIILYVLYRLISDESYRSLEEQLMGLSIDSLPTGTRLCCVSLLNVLKKFVDVHIDKKFPIDTFASLDTQQLADAYKELCSAITVFSDEPFKEIHLQSKIINIQKKILDSARKRLNQNIKAFENATENNNFDEIKKLFQEIECYKNHINEFPKSDAERFEKIETTYQYKTSGDGILNFKLSESYANNKQKDFSDLNHVLEKLCSKEKPLFDEIIQHIANQIKINLTDIINDSKFFSYIKKNFLKIEDEQFKQSVAKSTREFLQTMINPLANESANLDQSLILRFPNNPQVLVDLTHLSIEKISEVASFKLILSDYIDQLSKPIIKDLENNQINHQKIDELGLVIDRFQTMYPEIFDNVGEVKSKISKLIAPDLTAVDVEYSDIRNKDTVDNKIIPALDKLDKFAQFKSASLLPDNFKQQYENTKKDIRKSLHCNFHVSDVYEKNCIKKTIRDMEFVAVIKNSKNYNLVDLKRKIALHQVWENVFKRYDMHSPITLIEDYNDKVRDFFKPEKNLPSKTEKAWLEEITYYLDIYRVTENIHKDYKQVPAIALQSLCSSFFENLMYRINQKIKNVNSIADISNSKELENSLLLLRVFDSFYKGEYRNLIGVDIKSIKYGSTDQNKGIIYSYKNEKNENVVLSIDSSNLDADISIYQVIVNLIQESFKNKVNSLMEPELQNFKNCDSSLKGLATIFIDLQKMLINVPAIALCIEEYMRDTLNKLSPETLFSLGEYLSPNKEGKEIINYYKQFKRHANLLRNSLVTKTSAEDVSNRINLLYSSSNSIKRTELSRLYTQFEKLYKQLLNDNLQVDRNYQSIIKSDLTSIIQKISQKKRLHDVLPEIIANIFALWTLNDCQEMIKSLYPDELKETIPYSTFYSTFRENSDLLQKPYSTQVIAIFRLLDFEFSTNKDDCLGDFNGHLMQVLTGEGKSIILAVTNIVLALLGYDVSSASYSEYLSQRDWESFKELFQQLEVDKYIHYGTFNVILEHALNEEFDLRESTKAFIEGIPNKNIQGKSTRPKRLTMDEFDSFPINKLPLFQPILIWNILDVQNLIHKIWNNKDQSNFTYLTVLEWDEYTQLKEKHPKLESLFKHAVITMINDLKTFSDSKKHSHQVKNGKITYTYLDGYTQNQSHGYKTMWAAYQEFSQGNISEQELKKHLGLNINCGRFLYNEFFKTAFPRGIIGLSGTIPEYNELKFIANTFNIKTVDALPSAFGSSRDRCKFNESNVSVLWDNDDFFKEIAERIQSYRTTTVNFYLSGIVFFRNEKILQAFHEYIKDNYDNLLEDIHLMDKPSSGKVHEDNAKIRKAVEKGSITLAIAEHARGRDFVCYDSDINNNGGVWVLSTFLPEEVSEQVQQMGRTGRRGEPGLFDMVLFGEDLHNIYGIEKQDLEFNSAAKRYTYLDSTRKKHYSKKFHDTQMTLNKLTEDSHQDSMEFLQLLKELFKNDDNNNNAGNNEDKIIEKLKKFDSLLSPTECNIMLLMDATNSMGRTINVVKETINENLPLINNILEGFGYDAKHFHMQIAVYRNLQDNEAAFQHSPWTNNTQQLVNYVANIEAKGGYQKESNLGLPFALYQNEHANGKDIFSPSYVIMIGDIELESHCNKQTLSGIQYNTWSNFTHEYKKEGKAFSSFHSPQQSVVELKAKNIPVYTFFVPGNCYLYDESKGEKLSKDKPFSKENSVTFFRNTAKETKGEYQELNTEQKIEAKVKFKNVLSQCIFKQVSGINNELCEQMQKEFVTRCNKL